VRTSFVCIFSASWVRFFFALVWMTPASCAAFLEPQSEAASLCFRTAITFAILSGLSGATFVAAAVREKGLEVSVPPPLAGGEELSRTGGNGGGYRPV